MELTNGKTYKEFYNDARFWHSQAWHEGELLLVNGRDWGDKSVDAIPDDAVVSINGGVVQCENYDWHGCDMTMDALFAVWRGDDSNKTLLVKVPLAQYEAFCQYLQIIGGHVGV